MIPRRHVLRTLIGGAAALAVLAPALACAQAPVQPAAAIINDFCDVLLSVMKGAKALGVSGRYQTLDPAVRRAFNLPLMTRLAVGPDWQKLGADEQQKLTEAFSDYSIATYAARFDGYSGERFDVDPNPTPTTDGVIVNTKLVKSNSEAVQLNYLMRQGDAGWQIIDVFLAGTVSQLATQRSEFSAILRRDGAQALLNLLKQRVADLRK